MHSQDPIIIAIMGVTGAGKSTFIRDVTGLDVNISHGIESETQDISVYDIVLDGRTISLIDTPGFDDTYRSDAVVLDQVSSWLAKKYREGVKINGIIFLHRISDNRIQGSALKTLRMFQKLVGDTYLKNVILATTMWDLVNPVEGEQREMLLMEKYWDQMTKFGMKVRRLTGHITKVSILRELMENIDPQPLLIQTQMVDEVLE